MAKTDGPEEGKRPERPARRPDASLDMSAFANQAVEAPRRSERWFAYGLVVLIGLALGIFFALR